MEKIGALERETIMSVLSEGRELANELKRKLQPTTDSREACDILVENILSSYENAIKLLDNCMALHGNGADQMSCVSNVFDQLPNSIQGSTTSEEGSDLNSKDDQLHKCKKRKTLPKWSEQVRVLSETGIEGQLDDGYNWRKYGQKDILGANHPRAYYRCTRRNTQGCLATKQVQRADDDPSIFKVIYRGKHSCMQERLKQNNENLMIFPKKEEEEEEEESPMNSQETIMTTEPSLKVEKQELVAKDNIHDHFPSFSFPSTPIESENLETQFFSKAGNFNIGTDYSPHDQFLSPETSESYFSMPQCPINDFVASSTDFAEIISNSTPFTNFPFGEMDISIDHDIDFSSQLLDAIDYF